MKPVCTNHKIHNFSPSGLSRKKNVLQGYYMPCFEHGSVRKCFLLSLTCFLLAILLSQGWAQSQKEALAGRLAPSVLRFHVLAESDSREDQQVKLEVRSLLLDYLKKHLPDQADKADTIACLKKNRAEIEQLTDYYLQKQGFDYHASLQLANDYFPTRVYGRLVFPCGYYDAARITLGKGKGHNWWCVLYPQFCFIDSACVATPEESLQRLKEAVGEEDWLALQNERPKLQIRFLLFSRHSSDTP